MALFSKPSDEPRRAPNRTINGKPQGVPESPSTVQRRFRLFAESVRRVAGHPLAAQESRQPIGDGLGLEDVVRRISPVFKHDDTLVSWTAIRGAIAALYIHTWDQSSLVMPFVTVETAMSVGHIGDIARGDDTIDVAPEWQPRLSPDQQEAAVGVYSAVFGRVANYGEYSQASPEEVRSSWIYPGHAVALDMIAWIAVAFHRIGLAEPLITSTCPEPDLLEAPGWYVEPLWGQLERYWDGSDWTSRCRLLDGRRYQYANFSI